MFPEPKMMDRPKYSDDDESAIHCRDGEARHFNYAVLCTIAMRDSVGHVLAVGQCQCIAGAGEEHRRGFNRGEFSG